MTIRADANKLPFKESSFDCIVSVETVDYLDAKDFFKECSRVLRNTGYLLFASANKHSYKRYVHRVLSSYRTFYRYSFEAIRAYLGEEGFKIEKCVGYNWIPFKRNSNSILIGVFEFLEKILRLTHLPRISPWVFFIAKKREK